MNDTEKTLRYYDTHADEYVAESLGVDMSEQYGKYLQWLSKGSKILDLGCGSGRDSKFFIERGFDVTPVDGSGEMCLRAEKIIGKKVRKLTFDELDYDGVFDGVWACASLLHVKKDEMNETLKRVSRSMKPDGVLYISFRYGDDERTSSGMIYSDYTEDTLDTIINNDAHLRMIEWWISEEARPEKADDLWINVICCRL